LPRSRPPLLLGCLVVVGAFAIAGVAFVVFITFLESGADTGEVTLNPVDSYAPGTVIRLPDDGFFVVAPLAGPLIALSDLDAANRAAEGRVCRVAPIPESDPALLELLTEHQARMSPEAGSMLLIFREDCYGALYDGAGVRIDVDGPNLDRLGTSADEQGRLVVDTAARQCSRREGTQYAIPVDCPD
jgi:hypothetical protein